MMEKRKKAVNQEEVSCDRRTEPYFLYRTEFSPNGETALYLHWHSEAEFLYLEKGTLEFVIEDVSYRMQEGDVVLVAPNLLHMAKCVGTEAGVYRTFVFSVDLIAAPEEAEEYRKYVQPMLRNPIDFCLCLTGGQEWQEETIHDLKRLFYRREKNEDADLMVRGLLYVIWQNLYDHRFREAAGNREADRLEQQLQDTFSYIHAHFQEELSLEELAKTAHVSEGQLCRSFKRLTGATPFTYIKRYRIVKSCAYLKDSDKKISEICALCGFHNISYFNREFLRMMRVTPTVYRTQCRKENRT